MESFSEREGHISKRNIQIRDMDKALRTSLWNTSYKIVFEPNINNDGMAPTPGSRLIDVLDEFWLDFLKEPINERPWDWLNISTQIQSVFLGSQWNVVYDAIESLVLAVSHHMPSLSNTYIQACNDILEREVSGYRLIGQIIVQVTNVSEIATIENSLASTVNGIRLHIGSALKMLSDRSDPDYRNSIKEAISAVEASANFVAGNTKLTLGDALKSISDKIGLHPALRDGYLKIYGYTSDADGIRHFLMEQSSVTFDDAKFMLVSCSAFSNYLIAKGQEAGLIK